jgi:hypothetical protein
VKKIASVLCLLALSVFAAGVEPEPHQVHLNGKPMAYSILVSGSWVLPVDAIQLNFAKNPNAILVSR